MWVNQLRIEEGLLVFIQQVNLRGLGKGYTLVSLLDISLCPFRIGAFVICSL